MQAAPLQIFISRCLMKIWSSSWKCQSSALLISLSIIKNCESSEFTILKHCFQARQTAQIEHCVYCSQSVPRMTNMFSLVCSVYLIITWRAKLYNNIVFSHNTREDYMNWRTTGYSGILYSVVCKTISLDSDSFCVPKRNESFLYKFNWKIK